MVEIFVQEALFADRIRVKVLESLQDESEQTVALVNQFMDDFQRTDVYFELKVRVHTPRRLRIALNAGIMSSQVDPDDSKSPLN